MEQGWCGQYTEDRGLCFERVLRGVKDVITLDAALINSADARQIDRISQSFSDLYHPPLLLRRKDKTERIFGPMSLLESIFTNGKRVLRFNAIKVLGK